MVTSAAASSHCQVATSFACHNLPPRPLVKILRRAYHVLVTCREQSATKLASILNTTLSSSDSFSCLVASLIIF